MQTTLGRLNRPGHPALSWRYTPGALPTVMFLTGFRSDMTGSKALHLERHCATRGQGYIRFDYRGHGASGGRFEEGCIGDWTADTLAVLDTVAPPGPVVLVGSSMGGWIMLLVALARPDRVKGLVGIAPAPDFTEDLIRPNLGPEQKEALARDGMFLAPSAYGEPIPITRRLLEDGARHLVLRAPLPIRCPVHLLHGQQDPDVPWQTSLRLAGALASTAVTVELIKDGDHRLSREEDLRRIATALDRVLEQVAQGPSTGSSARSPSR
ncbi:alpha/beta hydrolase [Benzoatithermus flavus]|uniref:Palmitoyl-protein thioesterase ABHD10, mitochondrial n=1 Tax=Benzoatithermus flavus TaxID=3108223 RepID=A0ABU8XN00_9PROT